MNITRRISPDAGCDRRPRVTPPGWAIPETWNDRLRSGPRIETWKSPPAANVLQVRHPRPADRRHPRADSRNPIAPVNRGFVCPMGEAGLELLYHPDRIVSPCSGKGKRRIRLGTRLLGRGDEPRLEGPEALPKGKRARVGFLMGTRHPPHPLRGIRRPTGLLQLLPGGPGVNELGLWQPSGRSSVCLRPESHPISSSPSGPTSWRNRPPRFTSTASTGI
jgi:hypothetical protein